MLAAALAAVSLVTPFSLGHINRHGDVPQASRVFVRGDQLSIDLPPRTALINDSNCQTVGKPIIVPNWIETSPRGRHEIAYRARVVWDRDGSYRADGPVVDDGVAIANYSRTRWANVYAHISRVHDGNCR